MAPPAGAGDAEDGIFNLLQLSTLNHRCEITSGVCEAECRALLQNFLSNHGIKRKGKIAGGFPIHQKTSGPKAQQGILADASL